jgi:ferredoxin
VANQIIVADCIDCAACEPDCPNEAISHDDGPFVIDPHLCDECASAGGDPHCIAVCPVDAIVPAA